jgi:hypothetical protein
MKPSDSAPQSSSPKIDQLAAKLAASNVAEMATSLAADPQVKAISTEYPDRALYVALVEDAHRPDRVRFAAALVLKSRAENADPQAIAQVFATALQKDLAGYAYPWGRLWADGDAVGPLGAMLVEIGRPAVPALTALLGDTTPRDTYLGSEEATDMAMRRYRVKDFAAFYLARIVGVELPWQQDLAKRDAAIANLRGKL